MSTSSESELSPSKTPLPRSRTLPPSPIRVGSPTTPVHSPRLSPNPPASAGLPPGTPATPTSKGRARDLLRKHYGLGIGIPAPSGNPADPMDVDSGAFDPKAYYEQLITVSSLSALLKKDNDLVSEIRQLESERQALVYNHHHELIAASDTIKAMKQRADSLDADLDKLKAAFSEISRLSSEVTEDDSKESQ